MNDLLLFRLLRAGELDAAALAPLLEDLARLSHRDRFAFLGLVPRALDHEDRALRIAALGALAGSDGLLAFRGLVARLSDPVAEVRRAAVEALRLSARSHPARFAHALFHPLPDVRRAAIDGELPLETAAFAFHLLADPACGDELRRRLADESGAPGPPAEVPVAAPASLPALFDFVGRGLCPRPLARRIVMEMPWSEAAGWLGASPGRSPEACDAILLAAEGPAYDGAAGEGDTLDRLFELFWEERGVDPRAEAFFRRLSGTMLGWDAALSRRAIASLVRVAAQRGAFSPAAAGLTAVFHARFLGFPWVPREVRHEAIAAIYAAGGNVPRLEDDAVKALLDLDLCVRASGSLDLWAIGGLLHFVQNHPYKRLLRWVSIDAVVAAFAEDVEYAVPFLGLRDDSKRGRAFIVERTVRSHPLARGRIVALLILAAPTDQLEFAQALSASEARDAAGEMLALLDRRSGDAARPAMSAKKTSEVASLLAGKIAQDPGEIAAFLRAWLDLGEPRAVPLGLGMLGALGGLIAATERFVELALALDEARLLRLLAAIPACSTFPYGKELGLAHALASHASAEARAWASERLPPPGEALPIARPTRAETSAPRLAESVLAAIVAAPDAKLAKAVAPCFARPSSGLCDALAERSPPAAPSVAVCVAILGSHDPMERVDAELARFGSESGAFLTLLDAEMVRVWEREQSLPPLAHAWIHRWERHAFALADALVESGLADGLLRAAGLRVAVLRESVWDAIASALAMWRYRDRERLAAVVSPELGDVLLAKLPTDLGEAAARSVIAIAEAGVAPELVLRWKASITRRLPELAPATRRILGALVDSRGLVGQAPRRRAPPPPRASVPIEHVQFLIDLDELAALASRDDPRLAEEAAFRLIALGEPGLACLVEVLRARPPALRELAATIPLWPDGPALTLARMIAFDRKNEPDLRFFAALALVERGERAFLAHAFEAARAESESWFTEDDYRHLEKLVPLRELSIELAASPHAYAYRPSIEALLKRAIEPDVTAALLAFLETGTDRMRALRRGAAAWLMYAGVEDGFPILLATRADEKATEAVQWPLDRASPELVAAAVDAVLTAGARAVPEKLAIELLNGGDVDLEAKSAAYERILAETTSENVRAAVYADLAHGPARSAKLRAIAETFAWGMRRGRELTGRLFKVEMVAGAGLGHTRLTESRVFVSPLPILREEQGGREIVEGLILHELGHHRYHGGPDGERIWATSAKEHIQGLVNLVLDEHLERNLRAIEASYGDRLKRLSAYAFQHADREVPVASLLGGLGGRAFEVLAATRLDVARHEGSVRVASGAILLQMERAGLSFARFFRALRMGLGDRHGDPLVAAGLALFKGGFKKRSLDELLDLARKLRALFGAEASLVERFGPHETLEGGADGQVHGEGITQAEIDAEIERVTDPEDARRRKDAHGGGGGRGGRAWIDVTANERFEPIHNVVRVVHDRAAHQAYASQTALASRRMRRYLDELGVTLEPQRFRLQGRRFDRSRALAVVSRGDPRMLIAREPRVRTDLFLGLLVDCSGSMQTRGNIEKAKLFATMLAEAARGVRGVDVRVFGFTHTTIFDAGDAARCAAHALEADGGNNDAGALWHAALVARESRRRARLLVMISDGLPTECSVASLRALVQRLGSRHGICCAQVAVQPLAEVCFPNYVVLDHADPAAAVQRFGLVVAGLVRKAMAIA